MTRYLPKSTRTALSAQLGCRACGCPGTWQADHMHPRGLGGGNEPENYQRLCVKCHKAKTKRDVAAMKKVKRIIRKREGTWKPKRAKMQSRPFPKDRRRRMDGKVERRT